jgi:hypothetical protein
MTVHAPHETFEVRVRRGRIGRDDWQLLRRKLGYVEAHSVALAAGVEVVAPAHREKRTSRGGLGWFSRKRL